MKKVAISGYFDPIHVGHLEYIEMSKKLGDYLIVIVNNNKQCILKKGKPFMSEAERIEILKGFKYIDSVYTFNDDDETACDLIHKVVESYSNQEDVKLFFGNGGDRTNQTTPEMEYCKQHGVEMLWGVGGGKIQSSSDLIKNSTDE